ILVYFLIKNNTAYQKIFFYSLIPAILAVVVLFFVREKKIKKEEVIAKPKISFRKDFKNLDSRLKAYLVVSFIFTLGNSSNQFLLLRAKNLGFSFTDVILLYFVYNLSYALSSFPAGKLSDKLGRKLFLVISYIIYSLVYFGFALNQTTSIILFLFIFYGFYMGFNEATEKAFISEIAPSHLKATLIGLQATIVGLGLFPASLLAGILWKFFGPQIAFLFGSLMSILACVGLLLFI
ncbi:MAG: MFS transporter, partial [Candidatus Omnitrophota bacterium]